MQKILRAARKGTQVIYIPGNHDEHLRQFIGLHSAASQIAEEAMHVTAHGKRLWVMHGDLFDGVMQHARWLAHLGDQLYALLLKLNRWLNAMRQRLGMPYWSMSQYLKHQAKNAVNFISDFEHVMTEEARRRGCDGVVCGHIHKAEIREIDGILYCNDGDWVESMTALVETFDGELKLIHWRTRVEAPLNLGRIIDELPAIEGVRGMSHGEESHEDRDRDGRLGTAGQRRRADAEDPPRASCETMGHIGGIHHAAGVPHRALPDLPGYPPVAPPGRQRVKRRLADFDPDAIHIATEGPLGLAARRCALRARHSVHHRLPHALPRVRQGAHRACRCRGPTRSCAGSTGRRRR